MQGRGRTTDIPREFTEVQPKWMTEDERKHIEALQAEMEAWRPGDPPPEHSIQEHLKGVQIALDDVRFRLRRARILAALWLVAAAALILLSIFASQ